MNLTTQEKLSEVCFNEAIKWLDCLEPLSEKPKAQPVVFETSCSDIRAEFDKCVRDWRATINDTVENPRVKIRGDKSGLPPRQCAPLACLMEKCLFKTDYNFTVCNAFMSSFKHCCLFLYGSEYIL
jgi:hypothetical protein